MIILAGDSWSCGEWHKTKVVHRGLEYFLKSNNYSVINLGQGDGSNYNTHNTLKVFFNSGLLNYINEDILVLVFQTEWFRDYRIQSLSNDYIWAITEFNKKFIDATLSRWYSDLSKLAHDHNVKIRIIGGCSDTVSPVDFSKTYPGLSIACQSLTNYLCNNKAEIDRPVFGIYNRDMVSFFETFKEIDKHHLIDELDQGEARLLQWKSNAELFWPDGVHPNRTGHKKLFEYLQENGYLE